jgi:hypothetical protein
LLTDQKVAKDRLAILHDHLPPLLDLPDPMDIPPILDLDRRSDLLPRYPSFIPWLPQPTLKDLHQVPSEYETLLSGRLDDPPYDLPL